MAILTIPVHSDQDLSPRAAEVLRGIVDAEFPELDIMFKPAELSDRKVLVFGRAPADGSASMEYVYTYSIAQMMTKANASSVIRAGIQNMINVPEPIPFRRPVGTILADDVAKLDFDRPVAIDIETDGNLGVTHTPEEVNVISVAFYQEGQAPVVLTSYASWEPGAPRAPLTPIQVAKLSRYLTQFKYAIYHNGKFDVRILNRVLGVKLNVWFDTMLAHHVLNHAAGDHKLKTCARRYLGAPEWEEGLGKYTKGGGHYENIPLNMLVEYNGWDVYWTYKLYEFFSPQIAADEGFSKAFAFEMQAQDFLLDVEMYGIPMDMEYASDFTQSLETQAQATLVGLRFKLGKPEFNPNSPKQVKEALNDYGIFIDSTDEETMLKIIEANPNNSPLTDFCKSLLAYRKVTKTRSTYAEGWSKRARNGRVHPTFLVHGTSTGRLSSTGPNAQNMPRDKDIRKLVKTHG